MRGAWWIGRSMWNMIFDVRELQLLKIGDGLTLVSCAGLVAGLGTWWNRERAALAMHMRLDCIRPNLE